MIKYYDPQIYGDCPIGEMDEYDGHLYVRASDYAALEERVAELDREAARYRWLRNQNNREVGARILTDRMNVCAAIDKAMEG